MELISRVALLGVVILAGVLLFTPYEALLEAAVAITVIAAVIVGFSMHPRKEVFYVRTSVRLIDPDQNQTLERDLVAVKVELVRLWLLFLPTVLAVAFVVFFVANSANKFSALNWSFLQACAFPGYFYLPLIVWQYATVIVLILLWAWICERRVMRDVEACSARYFSISGAKFIGRVSYLFMGEQGKYYGGDCMYFRFAHPRELATVVFHNAQRSPINKIAMGFFFHRFIVLGRGVTDLDKRSVAAQTVLAGLTPDPSIPA